MSNISDLRASRERAGARYKTAVEELHQSFVALGALDAALANVTGEHLATFHQPLDAWMLVHPVYVPYDANVRALTNWHDEIAAKRDVYIRENQR